MTKVLRLDWARLADEDSIFNPKTWGLTDCLEGMIAAEYCARALVKETNHRLQKEVDPEILWVLEPEELIDAVISVPEKVDATELLVRFNGIFREFRYWAWNHWQKTYPAYIGQEFAEGEEG